MPAIAHNPISPHNAIGAVSPVFTGLLGLLLPPFVFPPLFPLLLPLLLLPLLLSPLPSGFGGVIVSDLTVTLIVAEILFGFVILSFNSSFPFSV